jgi:radical SAM superfamily enzyme YgiQ (UPF0313 family)
MDCLIVHTPKFNSFYKPLGRFMWINYMPMGTLAIADYLVKHGQDCSIIHQGLELMNDKNWKLEQGLKDIDAPVIGMTLHWHHAIYDVINSARKIKELKPDAFLVLGGFTADYFYDQIIAECGFIDGIIRGDAEVPLLRLVQAVKAGKKDLSDVPNLAWRDRDGQLVANAVTYSADCEMLSNLCFTNFELLKHYDTYIQHVTVPFLVVNGVSLETNYARYSLKKRYFPLALGRGCPFTCSWCSGSFKQRNLVTPRHAIAYRSHESIIADMQRAVDYGYEAVYMVFDPTPNNMSWFLELFRKIRAADLGNTGVMFELTGISSREFIDAFADTFTGHRMLSFSPESALDTLRRRNKTAYFSTENTLAMIDYAASRDVDMLVFFAAAIPGETEVEFRETIRMADDLKKKYKGKLNTEIFLLELEPGSPWQAKPEAYGIVTERRTFWDFYRVHADPTTGTFTSLGYYIPGYFEKPLDPEDPERDFERRILQLKCDHFCALNAGLKNGRPVFVTKTMCNIANVLNIVTRKDSNPLVRTY